MSKWEEGTWGMWLYSILKREIMKEQRRESILLMYLARRKGHIQNKEIPWVQPIKKQTKKKTNKQKNSSNLNFFTFSSRYPACTWWFSDRMGWYLISRMAESRWLWMVSLHTRASREKGGTALCFKGSKLKRILFFKFLSRRETLTERI